jgi:cell division protein FtsB
MPPAIPEAPSRGWAIVTQSAFVGCLLLLFGGLAIALLPELKQLRQTDQQIVELKSKAAALLEEKEKLQQTSILLTEDKEFVEFKARDELNMKKPGEKIFRFED